MAKNPKVKFGTGNYDYDMIVIGAGIGGLATTAMLAKEGLKILVLEQSDIIGGCCSTFEDEGYKLDVGASIVELTEPMYEVFKRCDRKVEDYMDLISCDPIYAFVNEQGQKFAYPVDWDETVRVISEINREDGESFKKFAEEGRNNIEKYVMPVLSRPMQNITDALKTVALHPGLITELLPKMVMTHETVIKKYFKDPIVLGSMAFQSYFAGAAPELCPGFMGLVALTEHYGIYYPRGGMIGIPNGLAAVAREYGAEIKTKTLVDRILVNPDKSVRGVRLGSGEEITAPIVTSNVSALTTYKNMIGRENLPWHINVGIDSYTPSMGCPMIYLGLDKAPDLNAHHTMLAAPLESMNKVWYDYKADVISRDAGLSLACWPSEADPSLAPKGKHIVNFVYNAPVPYAPMGSNWDLIKDQYLEEGIDFFDRVFSPGIKKHINYAKVSTPLDFERRLLAPRGCIYGLDFDITAIGPLRPRSRSWAIKNLYLVGASTHMSGGIPTVMSSSLITSDLIKQDHL